MKFRKWIAVFLVSVLVVGLFPLSVSAQTTKDLSACHVLINGEGWQVFTLDEIDEVHSEAEFREVITVVDDRNTPVPADAYDIVVGMSEWDDETQTDIFTPLSEPYGLTCSEDYMGAGFGSFAVYAVAAEGGGYTGRTENLDFMLWHRYSFNYFGAQIDFDEDFRSNSTWFWHDYYKIPEDSIHEPIVYDISGERVDPQNYELTYFVRNTELPDFDDPDYQQKVFPEDNPLEALPTEIGSYFVRIDGKAPYYGTGYVDFDIVEVEVTSFASVRGEDRRYYDGSTIYIPEGGEAYICFDLEPYEEGLIPGWRNDLLAEEGFAIDDDPTFFEDDPFAYAHVMAGDLKDGAFGTLYYNWYRVEDIFGEGAVGWMDAAPVYSASVNIAVGEEPDPETFAFIYGEERVRYYSGDTISIQNGEEILLTFDLTYYPDFLLGDRTFDALREAGFTVKEEIVSFEDAGFKYHQIKADGLAPGTKATIPCDWYLFDDYFDKENHEPLYHGEVTLEVADEPAGYLLGDADGDGAVSIVDATLIQRYLAKMETYAFVEAAADVNRSGAADIADVTAIQRYLAKAEIPESVDEAGVYGTYFAAWNINERVLPDDSALEGKEASKAEAEIRAALDVLVDRREIGRVLGLERKAASSFVSDYISDADGSSFIRNAGEGDFDGYFDTADYDAYRDQALEILKKYFVFDAETGRFENFPALRYVCNEGAVHEAIGEWIRDTYAAYGIPLEVQAVRWDDYSDVMNNGEFSVLRYGWVVDFDDPLEFLSMWTSNSEDNGIGFGKGDHRDLHAYDLDLRPYGVEACIENGTWAQTYDVLIDAIRMSRSRENRYRMLHLAEDMVMNSGCILPLYYY